MNKRILVILGHPNSERFCGALFNAYTAGAETNGSEVRKIKLGGLTFNPVLWQGYNEIQELEPDLVEAQTNILWAEHIVFIYPNWWGSIPALMKGFIDRTFLPGFAFKYRDNSALWDKRLTGRTAELLVTMDTPPWYYRWIYGNPGHNQMKRTVLGFCGIKVTGISEFSIVKTANHEKRELWLKKAEALGRKA